MARRPSVAPSPAEGSLTSECCLPKVASRQDYDRTGEHPVPGWPVLAGYSDRGPSSRTIAVYRPEQRVRLPGRLMSGALRRKWDIAPKVRKLITRFRSLGTTCSQPMRMEITPANGGEGNQTNGIPCIDATRSLGERRVRSWPGLG